MAVQTAVLANPGRAFAGQIAEAGAPHYIRSKRAEAVATEAIVAGRVVLRGTADDQVIAITNGGPAPTALNVAGVALLETSRALEDAPVAEGGALSVMRFGVVYMTLSATVSAGSVVCVGVTAGNLANVGETDDLDHDPITGLRFLEGGVSGDLVKVFVNLS